MSSIRLHPKFGVNPSCTVCFFCGDAKEVVLFGAQGASLFRESGGEAPSKVLLDYEPCPKCATLFKGHVLLVEAARRPAHEGQPPIVNAGENVYPTGPYAVVTAEAATRLFNVAIPGGKEFVEPGLLKAIGAIQPKDAA